MNNPHPLAEEIKKWADDPEAWQWQCFTWECGWSDCDFDRAMDKYLRGVCKDRCPVRLIPKRNLIPAHLLPEGWEVERHSSGSYVLTSPTRQSQHVYSPTSAMYELLRHIDREEAKP